METGCDGCARCCENFTFQISGDNKEWIEELGNFFKLTRPDLMSIVTDGNIVALQIKAPCQYLKDKKCIIYEQRPNICRNFLCDKAKKKRFIMGGGRE